MKCKTDIVHYVFEGYEGSMKKIGILTFSFADNYGAVLQCFALKKYIEKNNGSIVRVIKYMPRDMVPIRLRIRKLLMRNEQQQKFDEFRKNYFDYKKNDSFDVVIVGSDQVWNPEIISFNPAWIDPDISTKKLIAYGASVGKRILSKEELSFFEDNILGLKKYSAIGMRENDGKKMLDELGINASVVCDPTFLLMDDIEEYNMLSKKSKMKISNKFILVYVLEKSDSIDKAIMEVKGNTHLDVVSIHPMNCKYAMNDLFIENAGPEDFLWLVKNCELVITNSFHGLAFSMIYGKKTITVNHSSKSSRQKQLLEMLGEDVKIISDDTFEIKAGDKFERLRLSINASQSFINENI